MLGLYLLLDVVCFRLFDADDVVAQNACTACQLRHSWCGRAGVAEAGSGARTMAAAEPQSPLQAHR